MVVRVQNCTKLIVGNYSAASHIVHMCTLPIKAIAIFLKRVGHSPDF